MNQYREKPKNKEIPKTFFQKLLKLLYLKGFGPWVVLALVSVAIAYTSVEDSYSRMLMLKKLVYGLDHTDMAFDQFQDLLPGLPELDNLSEEQIPYLFSNQGMSQMRSFNNFMTFAASELNNERVNAALSAVRSDLNWYLLPTNDFAEAYLRYATSGDATYVEQMNRTLPQVSGLYANITGENADLGLEKVENALRTIDVVVTVLEEENAAIDAGILTSLATLLAVLIGSAFAFNQFELVIKLLNLFKRLTQLKIYRSKSGDKKEDIPVTLRDESRLTIEGTNRTSISSLTFDDNLDNLQQDKLEG